MFHNARVGGICSEKLPWLRRNSEQSRRNLQKLGFHLLTSFTSRLTAGCEQHKTRELQHSNWGQHSTVTFQPSFTSEDKDSKHGMDVWNEGQRHTCLRPDWDAVKVGTGNCGSGGENNQSTSINCMRPIRELGYLTPFTLNGNFKYVPKPISQVEMMYRANLAKYKQHPDLQEDTKIKTKLWGYGCSHVFKKRLHTHTAHRMWWLYIIMIIYSAFQYLFLNIFNHFDSLLRLLRDD